jgi:hypothetical protein
MAHTTIREAYLPNTPTNPERPEIHVTLTYTPGRGYNVWTCPVKRSQGQGYETVECYPFDGRRYDAGRCTRRSKDRDAAALAVYQARVDAITAANAEYLATKTPTNV